MEKLDLSQEEDDLRAKEFLAQHFKSDKNYRIDFLGWEDHEHGVYKISIANLHRMKGYRFSLISSQPISEYIVISLRISTSDTIE